MTLPDGADWEPGGFARDENGILITREIAGASGEATMQEGFVRDQDGVLIVTLDGTLDASSVPEDLSSLVEDWHEIGGPGEPPFKNSWTNGSGSTCAYLKDPFGFVHLKGGAPTGGVAGTVGFTLPAGYRPTETLVLGVWATVDADGDVHVQDGAVLDGYTFKAG